MYEKKFMGETELWKLGMESIRSLEADRGILASGRDEAYGCIFGRDSLITALKLMRAGRYESAEYFLPLVEKILRHLALLQGTALNIESGEEPGKIIHEYRPDHHEHLTTAATNPWYVYPDGTMRNYDSVDSTALYLIALSRYATVSNDQTFIQEMLPSVQLALRWLKSASDHGFIRYAFSPERIFGGLRTQSWMDSSESIFYEHGEETPPYPIAPLEVQAYAWSALKMWGEYFNEIDPIYANTLLARAAKLKSEFNTTFVQKSARSMTLAFAIDGNGNKLTSPRSSMGHVLWAAHGGECILDHTYIPHIAHRLLARDLFVPGAGIRTLSNRSAKFDPHSYHNGSIWPHDTAIVAEGLENFGFNDEARRVRDALISSYRHFQTPIELFAYKRGLREYQPASGHRACRTQAWSAGALLATLAARARYDAVR